MRISYHCWTESLVDLTGRSINSAQYYYVSNGQQTCKQEG